jgi:photosystem II stability/assembly factor-like uncharacterized protein
MGVLPMLLQPAHALHWESIPIRTAFQRDAGLPGGEGFQMVMDISYAPSNPEIAYLAVDTTGVWKSIDSGKTWFRKSNGIFTNGVRSLLVDPRNPDIVYAAGFGGHSYSAGDPSAASGLFRTTNGGRSWQFLRETAFFKQTQGKLLALCSPRNTKDPGDAIYAGSYTEGLLRSDDGGATWRAVDSKINGILALHEIPKSSGQLWIASEDGLFKYDGQSLRRYGENLPAYPRGIAVSSQNSDIVYAALGWGGVHRSVDGGRTFAPYGKGLPPLVNCANVAISPADPKILYVSFHESGIPNPYYSTDGGTTWKPPITVNDRRLFHVDTSGCWYAAPISPHPHTPPEALSVANGANIVIKTQSNGQRWRYSNTGYTGGVLVQKTSLCFAGAQRMLFGLVDFGCWLTEDGGQSFSYIKTPTYRSLSSCSAVAMNSDTIVAAIGSWNTQAIHVSWNRGRTWTVFGSTEDSYKFVSFHPQNPSIIYAGQYRSDDGGRRWRKLDHRVRALYPPDGDIIYSFSAGDKVLLLKSINRGDSWSPVHPALPPTRADIQDICVDPRDPETLYLGASDGVRILKQGRWKHAGPSQGLAQDQFGLNLVRAVTIDPNRPEVLYAGKWSAGRGSSNGVFRSTDSGASWVNISANLGPDLEIASIFVSPLDSTVLIGTYLGTWKLVP